ncbi:MAG: recombinase family protein [Clostridia bacterium]|nr:recombinase family protein [Clostridia bacterium]
MKLQDNYDVGIYCRLSRDDHNGTLESMSIANQRQVLVDYVTEKGWTLRDCYIDDGYTGTNFDRPDFKRMIHDAEIGKIDCIITKDLSRLGRNYVEAGYYTEEYFIEHDIRFIAINDGIDTMHDNNDIAAFHHVLNEFYPKQVSKKVRQVKKKSAEQGKFMGSQAPYGYMKSPEDKHILIIDEDAAIVVRRLFNEFANGDSARMIADKLNSEGVSTPRFYHYEKLGKTNPLTEEKNVWGSATILQLLRNQVYIGNMVQGKRQVVSFKTKKMRQVSPENWIVVENTHVPLVDKSLWERVQEKLGKHHKKIRRTKNENVGLFSGIVKCSDCNMPLAYMRKHLKDREKGVYRCSRYNNNGSGACSSHYIDEEYISAFVLDDIRNYAQLAVEKREELAEKLYRALKKTNSSEISTLKSKVKSIENRLFEINDRIKNLYEDKCLGKIPEDVALSLMQNFTSEKTELETKLPALKNKLVNMDETVGNINEWLNMISAYENITELDREIVCGLVESVTVFEKDRSTTPVTQEVKIEYRFIKNLLQNEKEDIA